MAGQPIQILDIVKVSRTKSKMKLREEVLSDVLGKAKGNKICLITTVGASRLGKSCFLNYVAKYLAHLVAGSKEDWLPPDSSKEITGFPFKNTMERQTTGFWIWDKPFNIPILNGSHISVFLMDTQGVFDEETMAEWSSIFGLALLTSSFLIYNINFNPQETCLVVLENFLQFGVMSMEKNVDADDNTPFQKLLFLVRDWNAAEEDGYGITHGQRFLDGWLNENQSGIPLEGAQRRKDIKRCFDKISCYLLPDPGEEAKSLNFQGATKDLNELFRLRLKKTIEELCKPKNLTIKKVEGRPAYWHEVEEMFIKYTNIFNSSSNPSPHSFLEAAHQSSCDGAARWALQMFETKLSKYFDSVQNVGSPSNIDSILEEFKSTAVSDYDNKRKLGSREMSQKQRENLVGNLQQQVAAAKLKLKEKGEELIQSLVEDTVTLFKQSFWEEVQKNSCEDDPIETKQLTRLMEIANKKAVARLNNEKALDDEELAISVISQLKARFLVAQNEFEKQNKEKLQKQEKKISEIINEFCEEYIEEIKGKTSYLKIVPEDKLKDIEAEQRTSILKKMSSLKDVSEAIKEAVKPKLVDKMSEIFFTMDKVNKNKLDDLKKQMEQLVNESADSFSKEFNDSVLDCQGIQDTTLLYVKIKDNVEGKFLTCSPINDLIFIRPYKIMLENRIQDIYRTTTASKEVAQEQNYEDSKTNLDKALLKIKSELQQDSGHYSSENEFLREINKVMQRFKQETEKQFQHISDSDKKQLMQYLDSEAKLVCDESLAIFNSGLKEASGRNKKEIERILTKYKLEMEELISNQPLISDLDMKGQHNRIVRQLKLSAISDLKHDETINNEIDKAFEVICEQTRMDKKRYEEQKAAAVKQAKEDFNERMIDHWNSDLHDEKEIRDIGDSCKEVVLAIIRQKLGNKFPLLGDSEQEANKEMEKVQEIKIKEYLEIRNKLKLSETEQKIAALFNAYSNSMNKHIEESVLDIAGLQNLHERELQQAEDRLLSFVNKLKLTTTNCQEAKANMVNKIRQEYEIIEAKLVASLESLQEEIFAYQAATVSSFEVELEAKVNNLLEQDDNLISELLKERNANSENYVSNNYAKAPLYLKEKSKAHIQSRLTDVVNKIQAEYTAKFKEVSDIMQHLWQALEKELKDVDYPDWADLKQRHDRRVKAEQSRLDKFCSFSKKEAQTAFMVSYILQGKHLFEKLKEENKIPEPDPTILNEALKEMCKFYKKEMKKHVSNINFVDAEGLRKSHATTSDLVEEKMKKKFRLSDNVKLLLRQKLNLVFKEFEEQNVLRFKQASPAIGIDLGTTFSCVAFYDKGGVKILPNEFHKNTTPSYVAFKTDGELIGEPAKKHAFSQPTNSIYDAKRLIGREFDDPIVQADIAKWPFKVKRGANGNPLVVALGNSIDPEEISAKILIKLKADAETHLGMAITKAVITVPANFNDAQRQATKDAGTVAGLTVLELLNEPTAAAIAYNLQYSNTEEKNVLIFDLGGGTFDVSLLSMSEGEVNVIAVGGDTHLGGEDFDAKLMDYCLQEFTKSHPNITLLDGKNTQDLTLIEKHNRRTRRLKDQCEEAKISLTGANTSSVNLDAFYEGEDLVIEIKRETFESLNMILFQKCIQIVEDIFNSEDVNLEKTDVEEIVLVGGSSKIPKIQELLSAFFNGKTLSKKMNPDEAVARGAAIRAAVLNGYSELKITASDVTAKSIGIRVEGGDMSVIIPKNTKYPVEKTKHYHNADEDEEEVEIIIFEGEHSVAEDNDKLGTFLLQGLPPGPAESVQIDVAMTIDRNGILTVTASCKANGVESKLVVQENKGRLTTKQKELLRSRQKN